VFTKDAMVTAGNNDADSRPVYFHHYHKGLSGVVIHDMLLCHAYAWNHNAIYGGSCGEPTELHKTHERLLESVGLHTELTFQCPKHHNNTATRRKTIPRSVFRKDDTRAWNPGYVDYLKRHIVHYPIKTSDAFTIAVHIRRGKFSPCTGTYNGYDPYLPNAHYQQLIQKYMQPNPQVVIFSQTKSFESFDAVYEKGYEVYLDEDNTHVWKTLVVADVVIQSRSSFSLIPAVMSQRRVIYTPFWHAPLEGWDVVGANLLQQTHHEMLVLQEKCP
jgi:hypothetical protein